MSYIWLPLDMIEDTVPVAEDMGVSEVARSARGFVTAYRRAKGNPNRMSDQWARKRHNFIKRHMAQVKKRREPLWKKGWPTRRHLALIMWAYSPDASRVEGWLDRIYEG